MPQAPLPSAHSADSAPFAKLSPAARTVWAKHDRKTDDWLPLWRHMTDSAAVAGKLFDEWLPGNVKGLLTESLPGGETDARLLVTFLAGAHDIGKATPAFACQVDPLADVMRTAGLGMLSAKEYGPDRRMAPHGLAGQLLLQEWLLERYAMPTRTSGAFAVVAGGHHGTPPEHQEIHHLQGRPRLLRHPGKSEPVWRRVQHELLDGCAELTGVPDRIGAWNAVRLPQTVQVLVTAIVIVADWIASSTELFPYDPSSWLPNGPTGEARRLKAAWAGLDLPGPWAPVEPEQSADRLFADRFDLPDTAVIRPVQEEAVRMARQMPAAGLLIIEAPMGEGKTEAAFAAAEILAGRTGAGGCLVALPTRATGDAMFPRLISWLEHLPLEGPRSIVLAHAKAALNDIWSGLLREGSRTLAAIDPDPDRPDKVDRVRNTRPGPAELHAHHWLRGRKKSLLASFAVGTIDQVLFAGLKSRHLALRHLAVAGKVVIIDEVHAYDAYMSRYLDRVLEWLSAYRVPVVLLSATLPAERRQALAAAYAGSDGGDLDTVRSDDPTDRTYPLITAAAPGAPALVARPAAASGRRTEVVLERLDDDPALLADRLAAELADGGCALVVRNTVDRVLQTADVLRERFGDDRITVTHSRFLAADRAVNDTRLRERFGPGGDRPTGPHVVVASQVVEQSLDVDFDLLVTDLAPVDLVLQRMGRLHRHPRLRPPRLTTARCLVTGVEWRDQAPPEPVRGSRAVYGEHTLLRALAALGSHLDGEPLVLPDHISPLVQAAYADEPLGPAEWTERMDAARTAHLRVLADKRGSAEAFLLGPVRRAGRPVYSWLGAGAGDVDDSPKGRAQVRDSEESLEVLVVRRLRSGRLTTVPWLDDGRGGLELPTDFPPGRRAAEAVAASAITLPWQFSRQWNADRAIAELEKFLVPAWQTKDCPWLAGELLLVLDEDCQTRLSGFDIRYSREDGLRVSSADAVEAGSSASSVKSVDSVESTGEDGERERSEPEGGAARVTTAADGRAGVSSVPQSAPEAKPVDIVDVLAETPVDPPAAPPPGPPSFDLVTRPWLPVQFLDGGVGELSLREVFTRAKDLRRLVGDVPTQELALLRLLLAILHDALNGPAEREDWGELWRSAEPFAPVPGYLDAHRDRFDLLHAETPFFQVGDLKTEKDEVSSLNRIVADVPNGDPFFAMRRPGVDRLSYAEASRWLVHAHAFDPSGIKSAMRGDSRAKAGKVYPLGVGSTGNLGGVFAEGNNLHETLLLNLIGLAEGDVTTFGDGSGPPDLPVWRRPPPGAAPEDPAGRQPRGLRDLYTWQSRRVRLHAEKGEVTGVVLGYGDPLTPHVHWQTEPMTGWRRSPVQEKKQGRPLVYMPRQHDPSRAAWRGLAALLPAAGSDSTGPKDEPRAALPSGVVKWFSMLTTEGELEPHKLIRVRLVGAVYGTQQSVVDEIVDDALTLPVVLLHEENPEYGTTATDAVQDAENAVTALGHLAADLARAVGSDPASSVDTARDLGFGALDGPYRRWLADLIPPADLESARRAWQRTVRTRISGLGRELLDATGPAAAEGRLVDTPGVGKQWINDARAELRFNRRLRKVLGLTDPPSATPSPGDEPGGPSPHTNDDDQAEAAT
ncbi:type I-E CRISPR-associated protein Cse1/CasA [Streptomyces sp. NPDC006798]|uniref:type I-E CRISPR-associated protein Cse1/CasA n=1 Tax=Streptomyces sp. NPDC006798 TaxID=3155462 RepID=UPI0033D1027C